MMFRNPFRRKRPIQYDTLSDRELGKATRAAFRVLSDTSDARGLKRLAGVSAALFLVDRAVAANATTLTLNLGSATADGVDVGDWTVTVCRTGADPDRDALSEADVVLAGTLHPDRATEAVDCFEKLTVCQFRAVQPDEAGA